MKYILFAISTLLVFSCEDDPKAANDPNTKVVSEDCKAVEALYSAQQTKIICLNKGDFMLSSYPDGESAPPEALKSEQTFETCAADFMNNVGNVPPKIIPTVSTSNPMATEQDAECIHNAFLEMESHKGKVTGTPDVMKTINDSVFECMNSISQKTYEENKEKFNCN